MDITFMSTDWFFYLSLSMLTIVLVIAMWVLFGMVLDAMNLQTYVLGQLRDEQKKTREAFERLEAEAKK